MSAGILYLLPSPITEEDISYMPQGNARIIEQVNVFITEERKSTIRYIKKAAPQKKLPEITFIDLNEHTTAEELPEMIALLTEGKNVALISEAGLPCVADPGAKLVALAHAAGIRVVPLTGPSSLFLALMSSGMSGQEFTFHGYLPRKPEERTQKIRNIEKEMLRSGYTQLFIEAPYRNAALLDALLVTLQPDTKLCLACEIHGETEFIKTLAVKDWKKNKPDISKKNCVFVLGKTL